MSQQFEAQSARLGNRLSDRHTRLLLKKKQGIGETDLGVLTPLNDFYIDARSGTYTADGSMHKPFKTLGSALSTVLTDANTATVIFHLAPGVYDATVSITKTTANQSFAIVGQSLENTYIQGGATWDSTRGDILYFRNFNDITIRGVTVQQGRYGVYTRACRRVVLDSCRMRYLGASNNTVNWDFSHTKTERLGIWNGNTTSDGGACRIRQTDEVIVKNCEVVQTLRGLRIQDAGRGLISNCQTHLTVESGIYLASTTYTHENACSNFLITGCTVSSALNNSCLIIGGKNNAVQGCRFLDGASAGVMLWHVKDATVSGNKIQNCNRLAWTGIGTDGDGFGQIYVDGNTAVPDESGYVATITNNTILQSNLGRSTSATGVHIRALAYPSACNKCYISNNTTDSTIKTVSPNITIVRPIADEITTTSTALNYCDATGPIQGQLNTKQSSLTVGQLAVCDAEPFSTSYKSKVDASETLLSNTTAAKLGYLDTASSIQGQLNTKQVGLTVGQLAVCDAEPFSTSYKSKVDASETLLSNTNAAKLGYLDVASSIQGQLTAKVNTSGGTFTGDVVIPLANLKVAGGTVDQTLTTNGSSGLSWTSSSGGISASDTVTWTAVHQFDDDVKNLEGCVVRQFRPTKIQQCSNNYETDSHEYNYVITPGGEANQHFTLPVLSTLPHGFEIKAYACSNTNIIFHSQGTDRIMKKSNSLVSQVQGGTGKNHFIWVDDNGTGTKRYISSR